MDRVYLGYFSDFSETKSIRKVVVFFFQAEDGIRDGTVTGVQTCALPISRRSSVVTSEPAERNHASDGSARRGHEGTRGRHDACPDTSGGARFAPARRGAARSEERRVGKECRCGWWEDH